FDSGGISIKPAQNMEDMKLDMSGAAAVLGTFEVLGRLKPRLNVTGVIPSTENLPSGTAVKPGDVVKSHFGKTIEIINTDAEGRLILCDALSYVRKFKPAAVLDAATLTGAVVVALGHVAIGVMGNDEVLINEVRDAGERAGERCWPLPLWDDYRELLKSDIADVKNSGGRGAGTIAGGWVLREFVNGFPWAHLDIAGTGYSFTTDSFALSNAQTLSDLLAHIPGVYVARGGIYGQAEIVLYGGRGPAGLEVFWDGVPHLPLGRDSVYLDPARISLAPLER